MKKAYPIILAAAVLIIGILFCIGILDRKDIGNAMLALFGTFLGATLAFRLEEEKERRKNADDQRKALNSALLILLRQYNALAQIEKDFANFPKDMPAAFSMPASKPPNYGELVHNVPDLEFLLDSSDPNILLELTVEQERFHQAIEAVNVRNEFYVNEVQKALSENKMNRKSFTPEEAESLLGDRIFGGAVNGAKNAREHVVLTCKSLTVMAEKLRRMAKELFPDRKFLMYEIQPSENHQQEAAVNTQQDPASAGRT